jgi:hypothetical protein
MDLRTALPSQEVCNYRRQSGVPVGRDPVAANALGVALTVCGADRRRQGGPPQLTGYRNGFKALLVTDCRHCCIFILDLRLQ